MQECHYDKKMTNVMILVGVEFVSARMSLWRKNDPGYDTRGIRVCKCKESIMTKQITKIMILVGLEYVNARMSLWQKKWPTLWYQWD